MARTTRRKGLTSWYTDKTEMNHVVDFFQYKGWCYENGSGRTSFTKSRREGYSLVMSYYISRTEYLAAMIKLSEEGARVFNQDRFGTTTSAWDKTCIKVKNRTTRYKGKREISTGLVEHYETLEDNRYDFAYEEEDWDSLLYPEEHYMSGLWFDGETEHFAPEQETIEDWEEPCWDYDSDRPYYAGKFW